MLQKRPVICVADADKDTIELLCEYLENHENYRVVPLLVQQIQTGAVNWCKFIQQHEPDLFIWDIPYPYQESWNFFELIRNAKVSERTKFILVTTNPAALERTLPEEDLSQVKPLLLGKPYHLSDITKTIEKLLDC